MEYDFQKSKRFFDLAANVIEDTKRLKFILNL